MHAISSADKRMHPQHSSQTMSGSCWRAACTSRPFRPHQLQLVLGAHQPWPAAFLGHLLAEAVPIWAAQHPAASASKQASISQPGTAAHLLAEVVLIQVAQLLAAVAQRLQRRLPQLLGGGGCGWVGGAAWVCHPASHCRQCNEGQHGCSWQEQHVVHRIAWQPTKPRQQLGSCRAGTCAPQAAPHLRPCWPAGPG